MSNYRNIVAIALVVLMVLSIYSLFSSAAKKEAEVQQHISAAESYAQEGLVEKSVTEYSEAITLNNDVQYYNIVSDLYYENGFLEKSITWAEETVSKFPNEPSGYARQIRGYLDSTLYAKAFESLETYDGRGLKSDEVEQYRDGMMSLYSVSIFSVEDITNSNGSYCGFYKKEAWGVATTSGSTLMNAQYAKVGYMSNGIIPVCTMEDVWFFADEDGNYIKNISNNIAGPITDVGMYNEGWFAVSNGSKYRYYDPNFEALPGEYDYAGAFNCGVAAVRNGTAWSLVDTNGKAVGSATFEEIVVDHSGVCCYEDVILAKSGGKYIFVDSKGSQIGKNAYQDVDPAVGGSLIAVKSGGKWGYADLKGNIVIEPQYENACSFANGYGAVCVDGLWGFIDENNVMRVPAEFADCRNMTPEGSAFVVQDNSWRILKMYHKNY